MDFLTSRLTTGHWARFVVYPLAALAGVAILHARHASADERNGFELAGASIPPAEIHQGGPPRDGIPAIDQPKFVAVDAAEFLSNTDQVLGVFRNGHARAYPIRILDYHEIVNDRFGAEPIVVTYCPLCGSGVAFSAQAAGAARRFGVSGLLYNSDVLLYDRETESLWSQILGQAISGPLQGRRLERIPITHTSWSDWRRRHPDTLVLSDRTGYRRDYTVSPYAGYEESRRVWFPVANTSRRYHPKERVIGLELDGRYKAYPFAELAKGTGALMDIVAGRQVTVRFDAVHRTGQVFDASGRMIPSLTAYWFAWYAFHPDTEVYQAKQ